MDIAVASAEAADGQARVTVTLRPRDGAGEVRLLDVANQVWTHDLGNEAWLSPGDYVVVVAPAEDAKGATAGVRFRLDSEGTIHESNRIIPHVLQRWLSLSPETRPEPARWTVVAGSPRSGTTLLQSVLCSAPSANPLTFEAVPFRALAQALRTIRNHMNATDKAYFRSDAEVVGPFRTLAEELSEQVRRNYGVRDLVLKEPVMAHYLPELQDLQRDLQIIGIVRDPRDIIVSMRRWGRKAAEQGEPHEYATASTQQLAQEVMSAYRKIIWRSNLPEGVSVCTLRYEDLVTAPSAWAHALERATGLDLSDYDPHADWQRSEIDFSDKDLHIRNAVTPLYGRPVSDSSIAEHSTELDAQDVKIIEFECRDLLYFFGYRYRYTFDEAEQAAVAAAGQDVQASGDAPAEVRRRLDQLERQLDVTARLRKENDRLRGRLQEAEKRAATDQADTGASQELTELRRKAGRVDRLAEENEKLKAEVKDLRPKAKNWTEIKDELSALRYKGKQADDLSSKTKKLETEVNELRAKADKWDAVAEEIGDLREKAKQLDRVKEQNAELKEELKQIRPKAQNWESVADELKQLRYRSKEFEKLQAENAELKSELQKLRNKSGSA